MSSTFDETRVLPLHHSVHDQDSMHWVTAPSPHPVAKKKKIKFCFLRNSHCCTLSSAGGRLNFASWKVESRTANAQLLGARVKVATGFVITASCLETKSLENCLVASV